ncbi:hypothetical protein, partial [Labrys wisconsinensis]|uniref:hypothetical protein n=1 Tax=Labrys wisconsinensis TaxID=425677 RepID=UPI0027D85C74
STENSTSVSALIAPKLFETLRRSSNAIDLPPGHPCAGGLRSRDVLLWTGLSPYDFAGRNGFFVGSITFLRTASAIVLARTRRIW